MRTLAMAAFVVLVGVAVLGQEAEPIAPIGGPEGRVDPTGATFVRIGEGKCAH